MHLATPNDMMDAAKNEMLQGREPQSHKDWCQIVNFLAFNVEPSAAQMAVKLMCQLYNIPLDEKDVKDIVTYQVAARI